MNLTRFKQIEAERNESRERAIVRKEDPDVAEVRCRMRQERGDRASYHAQMVNALRAHEVAREAREEESMEDPETTFVHRINVREEVTT